MKHPTNKAERLLNAKKKERARRAKEARAHRVRSKLAREGFPTPETEDAPGEVG